MRIRVTFDFPPIPVREMDYSAIDDDTYDYAPDSPLHPIGRGPTRDAALRDLAEQWDEDYTPEDVARLEREALAAQDVTTLIFLDYWRQTWMVGV